MTLLAEFDDAAKLIASARALKATGEARLEAYTPYPLAELEDALELPRSKIPRTALLAGVIGGASAYGLQYWLNGVLYPLDVGSRPLHSAPANVPITFEVTVLFASAATVIALLLRCGLPTLWHPLFEVAGFERAAIDRFFLSVDGASEAFDVARATRELEALGALRVSSVERPR